MPLHPVESTLLSQLLSHQDAPTFWVALSGGVDSLVLLKALLQVKNYLANQDPQVHLNIGAIHVNHGLQPSLANQWQSFCENYCKDHQVNFVSEKLDFLAAQKATNAHLSNTEAIARKARYQVFEQQLKPGDVMLMGHHQDDQAETLLYRLFRGTGLRGAVGIPACRPLGEGVLLRPLLTISRADLVDYATLHKLDWIEDPSNKNFAYQRNFIRHKVLKLIKQQWPQVSQTLARFTQVASEQRQLLTELAYQDYIECRVTLSEFNSLSHCQLGESSPERNINAQPCGLNIEKIQQLSQARLKNLIYYFYELSGFLAPSNLQMQELIRQIQSKNCQSIRLTLKDSDLVTASGVLQFNIMAKSLSRFETQVWSDIERPITLTNGVSLFSEKYMEGIRAPLLSEVVTVKMRQGGERVLPDFRAKATSLKNIYQEKKVPKELRAHLPLVYYNDALVAAPGVFLAKDFLVQKNMQGLIFKLNY